VFIPCNGQYGDSHPRSAGSATPLSVGGAAPSADDWSTCYEKIVYVRLAGSTFPGTTRNVPVETTTYQCLLNMSQRLLMQLLALCEESRLSCVPLINSSELRSKISAMRAQMKFFRTTSTKAFAA
jgi:hypothetical protein